MLAPLSQDNRGTVFYYGVQHIGDDQSISILVIHQRRINLVNRWPLFILKGLGECKPSCTNNCFEIELHIHMGLITKNLVLDGEPVIALHHAKENPFPCTYIVDKLHSFDNEALFGCPPST